MKLWSNGNCQRTGSTFNPERRLLAAILQRAITDYVSGEGELQESSREWLYGPDDNLETFGFAYICEALDFHIEELRKAIHMQYEANVASNTKETPAPVEETNSAELHVAVA